MRPLLLFLLGSFLACENTTPSTSTGSSASTAVNPMIRYQITAVPAENGRYTISPELPEDGFVAGGTELTIRAVPDAGYALDAIYASRKGGPWGFLHDERFAEETTLRVDKDLMVGANFVPAERTENLRVLHDVTYAQPGVKPLKYDVFAPEDAADLPGIVIVHGGGWMSNNEDIMRGLARELAAEGNYVVFSVDYRWVNDFDGDPEPNDMHELIEDVFGAIAHIQEHAADYGLDPTRLAVTGDSAGGHLSASAALLAPQIGAGGFGRTAGVYEFHPTYLPAGKDVARVRAEITRAIRAAAPSYGPFHADGFEQFVRQTERGYRDGISPLAHVPNASERSVPMWIVRGANDGVVPDAAIQPFLANMRAAGQRVEYVEVPNAGHAFFDWKPDAPTRATFEEIGRPYAARMRAFFDEVL